MQLLKFIPTLLVLLSLQTFSLQGQICSWEFLPTPTVFKEIVVVGNILVAGAENSIFKSSDFGLTWEQIPTEPYQLNGLNHLDAIESVKKVFIADRYGLFSYNVTDGSLERPFSWSWDPTTWVAFGAQGEQGYITVGNWGSLSGVLNNLAGDWSLILGSTPNDIPHTQKNCKRIICNRFDPKHAFVSGNNRAYRTDNFGEDWYEMPYEVINGGFINGQFYLFSPSHYSIDNGQSWIELEGYAQTYTHLSDTVLAAQIGGGLKVHILDTAQSPPLFLGLQDKRLVYLTTGVRFTYALSSEGEFFRLDRSKIETCFPGSNENLQQARDLFNVHPNPGNGLFEVQILDLKWEGLISVLSSTGQILKQLSVSPMDQVISLDLSAFPSGLYFIQLRNGHSWLSQRVIKQ